MNLSSSSKLHPRDIKIHQSSHVKTQQTDNEDQFDIAVVIGRFQPFHLGHAKLFRRALQIAKHVVIVLGSDQKARDPYNPFTATERIALIESSLGPEGSCKRISFCPVRDILYSDHRWLAATVNAVNRAIDEARDTGSPIAREPHVALLGSKKDVETKAYLDMFAGTWRLLGVDCWMSSIVPGKSGELAVVSGTDLRAAMFDGDFASLERLVTPGVTAGILAFQQANPEIWNGLIDEYQFYKAYIKAHIRREVDVTDPQTGVTERVVVNPYGVMFQTVDAVVVQNGHVLLVKRRNSPGKGLWALPGGFLKPDENRLDGVVRELRKETRIKLPEKVLRGSLREIKGFDHPRRSLRGRTITEAFFFRLDDEQGLPGVRGGDDAARAVWVPFADLTRREYEMFEDHFHIIEYFLARF